MNGDATAATATATPYRPAVSTTDRRNSSANPVPPATRAATERLSSCSTGWNRPGPATKSVAHRTDSGANASGPSALADRARNAYDAIPDAASPSPIGTVPGGRGEERSLSAITPRPGPARSS